MTKNIVLLISLVLSGCTLFIEDSAIPGPESRAESRAESSEVPEPISDLSLPRQPEAESETAFNPETIVGIAAEDSNETESENENESPAQEPAIEGRTSEDTAADPAVEQTTQSLAPMEAELDLRAIELCKEIGAKLGSVSVDDCLKQQLVSSGGYSVLNRPLVVREYPELDSRESIGRIMLIGGIHGDEYSSVSIVFKWMEILNQYHSGLFHWQIIPLSNPDGLLREQSQRQNHNGVDLNRNFPSRDWDDLGLRYWRERTASNARRYPGESSGSEPEVVWLVEQIEKFQPDVIISVHAPYHLVDYDGPPEAPERLGDLQLTRLGVFPGSLGNYAGVDLNKPVVTIELPYAGIMPSEAEISDMWTDLVAWLVKERSKQE